MYPSAGIGLGFLEIPITCKHHRYTVGWNVEWGVGMQQERVDGRSLQRRCTRVSLLCHITPFLQAHVIFTLDFSLL